MVVTDDGLALSIQERLYPDLTCFGCGHANPRGLKLRSYPGDGVVTARFTPWPEHDNGGGFLNGGIIATVLDCHSGAAMMLEAERLGLVSEVAGGFAYVTAGLDVRYLRPTPLAETLVLRAVVTAADPTQMTVETEILFEDKVRATAHALWRRWRPR